MKTIEKHIKESLHSRNIFPKDELWNQIEQELESKPKVTTSFPIHWFAVAASVLLLVTIAVFTLNSSEQKERSNMVRSQKNPATNETSDTAISSQSAVKTKEEVQYENFVLKTKSTHSDFFNTKMKNTNTKHSVTNAHSVLTKKEEQTMIVANAANEENKMVEYTEPQRTEMVTKMNEVATVQPKTKDVPKKYTNADALLFSVENAEKIQYTKKTVTEQAVAYIQEQVN